MLDIKLIRENPDTVRDDLEKRRKPEKLALLDELLKRDEEWRRLLTEVNNLRHRHNVVTAQIAEKRRRRLKRDFGSKRNSSKNKGTRRES